MKNILLLLFILKGIVMAIEEPNYKIIEKNDAFEIREYESYIIAQMQVIGNFDEVGEQAFPILFKYISGENRKGEKIEMTAPVIQENTKQKGEKIEMTAPVIQEMDTKNSQKKFFSFVMPIKYTLATIPRPLDARISIKEIPAKKIAVRIFSGFWNEENYTENQDILLEELYKANIKTIGTVKLARYNSPFSIWFMRRNEIMIEMQ